jgi:hypothetical protein
MIAATSWPDALLGVFGFVSVALVISVVVWQVFGSRRSSRSASEFRTLAEEATAAQGRTADALEQFTAELKELSTGTRELERMLKEVG